MGTPVGGQNQIAGSAILPVPQLAYDSGTLAITWRQTMISGTATAQLPYLTLLHCQ
jgi:hypothetical protein